MKERQILFSGAMVRALRAGRKTQTRRVIDDQTIGEKYACSLPDGRAELEWHSEPTCGSGTWIQPVRTELVESPYGVVGDRLWVRETFFAYGRWETRFNAKKGRDEWHFVDMTKECDRAYQYAADDPELPLSTHRGAHPGWWRRPAIFMPRVASRITLDITGVRVERLQACSEDDAWAEGCPDDATWPLDWYRTLWDSLNAERGYGWQTNPWVWVMEFKRVNE